MFFFEKQEAVSLSQAGVPWSISGGTLNIQAFNGASTTIDVVAPSGSSWSIDIEYNSYNLSAFPQSGTGSRQIELSGMDMSGQAGIFNYTIYLKSGSTTMDTATIRVKVTAPSI